MTAIHAEPYSNADIAEFEQLIFASANPDHKIRLLARCTLASFLNQHGRFKCDLMMERLSRAHDTPREQAKCTICAREESPGFYTGCMFEDGRDCDGWQCDGDGNLTRGGPKT